ncbi:hypothetical protein B2J88_07855 [Rhodococcus sp. SRB_17]|nr:hypothetical protein [Rhodococcus sp. SRB_17]
MASIRVRTTKDGNEYYQVLYRHSGKQTSDSFDDPKDANKFKRLVEQVGPDKAKDLTFGLEPELADTPSLTVAEWCTEYIDHLTGVEEATKNRYRAYLARDIGPDLGPLPLTSVNEQAIARWVKAQTGSAKTIANKHGFLSGALNGAVRANHITANPCEGRRLPRRHKEEEAVFLTPAEFARVRDAVTEQWQPLTVFLVTTGMRFSEATALQVGDIDMEERTARITRAWKYTGEAKRKLGPPKSRKSVRTINLSDQAIAALGDLKGRAPAEFVFINRLGRPVTAQLFHNKAWKPMIAELKAELGKKPRPHDLRHSCASWMIAAGVPLPVIQQHLGHESITTTIGIYGHLDRRSAQAASAALTAALTGL